MIAEQRLDTGYMPLTDNHQHLQPVRIDRQIFYDIVGHQLISIGYKKPLQWVQGGIVLIQLIDISSKAIGLHRQPDLGCYQCQCCQPASAIQQVTVDTGSDWRQEQINHGC